MALAQVSVSEFHYHWNHKNPKKERIKSKSEILMQQPMSRAPISMYILCLHVSNSTHAYLVVVMSSGSIQIGHLRFQLAAGRRAMSDEIMANLFTKIKFQ